MVGHRGGLICSNPFVELGKAARHLRLGACISFHGKERDVSNCPFIYLTLLKRQTSG
jgi:hypothetical protein